MTRLLRLPRLATAGGDERESAWCQTPLAALDRSQTVQTFAEESVVFVAAHASAVGVFHTNERSRVVEVISRRGRLVGVAIEP